MEKPNQDALLVRTEVAHEADSVFFGVFDGHGSAGTECAQFAKEKVRRCIPAGPHRKEATDARASGAPGFTSV